MKTLESKPGARWLTASNALTSLRLVAAPLFYWLISHRVWGPACLVFWLAVVSDYYDGRVARARGESSALGGLLDHATDAIFVSLGHVALAVVGIVPAVLPILIVVAFIQYVLDSPILAGRTLRASFVGRWNGIFYFFPPGIIVTREAFGFTHPTDDIVLILGWGLVISTLISMGGRLASVLRVPRDDLNSH